MKIYKVTTDCFDKNCFVVGESEADIFEYISKNIKIIIESSEGRIDSIELSDAEAVHFSDGVSLQ